MSPLLGLVDALRSLGIPIGGVLLGFLLGGTLLAAAEWLARRPANPRAGTIRIAVVKEPPPASPSAAPPSGPPVASVPLTDRDGTRTILLRGAGASPNAPLPRATRFLVALGVTFVVTSALELLFFAQLFTPYDHLVAYAGGAIFWPAPWPGVYAVTSVTQLVPDYIFPMYLAGMLAVAVAGGLVWRRTPLPPGRRAGAVGILLLYLVVEVLLDAIFFTVPGQSVRNIAILARNSGSLVVHAPASPHAPRFLPG